MTSRQQIQRKPANSTPPIDVRTTTSSHPASERSLAATYSGPPHPSWSGVLASNRAYRNHAIIRARP